MNSTEIALKIYKEIAKVEPVELKVLEILALSEKADLAQVLDVYRDLLNGKLQVIDVETKYELTDDQKKAIEINVKKTIEGEIIFMYEVNKDQEELIVVKSGNKILEINK